MSKNPYFIAEIGVNHEAKIKLAKKLIRDAKDGGANAIKLQCYKAEKIASKYAKAYWDKKENLENNQLKLFKKFDKFNEKDYFEIYKYCKKIKIDFIVTPFDLEIVNFFSNKVKYFKILCFSYIRIINIRLIVFRPSFKSDIKYRICNFLF